MYSSWKLFDTRIRLFRAIWIPPQGTITITITMYKFNYMYNFHFYSNAHFFPISRNLKPRHFSFARPCLASNNLDNGPLHIIIPSGYSYLCKQLRVVIWDLSEVDDILDTMARITVIEQVPLRRLSGLVLRDPKLFYYKAILSSSGSEFNIYS